MLLILGYSTEATIQHLQQRLQQRQQEFELLDLATLRDARRLRLSGNAADLLVEIDGREYDFCRYSAFYCRQYHADMGDPLRNAALDNLLGWVATHLEEAPVIVVNRPSAGMLNARKLEQLQHLQRCGLKVPRTVITGCPRTARELLDVSGAWASKSCSAAKTRAVLVDEQVMDRLAHLEVAPTTFQQVARGFDVRLHVVGEHLVPLKIVSRQFDYRFRGEAANAFTADLDLPAAVVVACRRYCRQERLVFAGFDFKVDEDGNWIVLEANPMPGFDYFDRQDALAGRIADALCDVLGARPVSPPPPLPPTPLVGAERRPVLSPFGAA